MKHLKKIFESEKQSDHKFSKEDFEDFMIELIDNGITINKFEKEYGSKDGYLTDTVPSEKFCYSAYKIRLEKTEVELEFYKYEDIKDFQHRLSNDLAMLASTFKKFKSQIGETELYVRDINEFSFIVKEREPIRLETEIIGFETCRKAVSDLMNRYIRGYFDVHTRRDEKTVKFVLPEITDRTSYNSFISKVNKMAKGVGWSIEGNHYVKNLSAKLKDYDFKITGSFTNKEVKLEFFGFRKKK